MKATFSFLVVYLLAFISFPASAQQEAGNVLLSASNGEIRIKSDAPLEMIEASSRQLKGVIDITGRSFSFSVNTRSIQGFNSPLQQEHFYENYMETSKFPVATFKGKIIEQIDLTVDGNYQLRAKGLLNVHGVEQERIIKADVKVKGEFITVTSSFTVPLSDHNITIPKIVYQKIAEEILVTVIANFTRVKN